MIKKVLIGCGGLIFACFAALVGLAIWQGSITQRAETDGRAFCAAIHPGDTLASVQAAAARHPAQPRFVDGTREAMVSFQGGIFNATACRLAVADGKVASVRLHIMKD
jgi:hypothetical protein